MAKVQWGAIVTDGRNKVGNVVYSRNRYGAYSRSFAPSISSNTSYQVTTRNRLSSLSTAWKSLSQTQRNAWNLAVSDFTHTDIFGSIIRPSGFDLYCKLNCNLLQVGVSAIDNPPTPGTIGTLSLVGVVADAVTPYVQISFDDSTLNSDFAIVAMATSCISPGKNYVKNLVREISIITPGGPQPFDATADYLAKYPSIVSTQRISIALLTVNKITGQKSPPIYATCIVDGPAGLDYNQALDTGIPLT